MPSNANKPRDFGEHCLSSAIASEFCWLSGRVAQPLGLSSSAGKPKAMAGGSLFFGFFLLAEQKKEPRQSGETDKAENYLDSELAVSGSIYYSFGWY